jgi:hypothetical protein
MNTRDKMALMILAVTLFTGNTLAAEEMNGNVSETGSSSQTRTERQVQKLEALMYDPFSFRIETASDTLRSLGKALKADVGEYAEIYEDDTRILQRNVRLEYKELTVDYVQYQFPDSYKEFWTCIRVSDPVYELKYGIKVGMKESELVGLLGEPDRKVTLSSDRELIYENDLPYYDIHFVTDNGKVRWIDFTAYTDD